jgi:general stress protein 26
MAKADDDGGNDTRRLRKLFKGIRVAMLTTISPDGTLRSRPMEPVQGRFEGELWFFAHSSSPVAAEIREQGRVNVIYVDQRDDVYVSILGTSSLVTDRDRIQQHWKPRLKSWFPEGRKDQDLALLRILVESAEYWDRKQGRQVRLSDFGEARVTSAPPAEPRRSEPAEPPGPPPGSSGAQG